MGPAKSTLVRPVGVSLVTPDEVILSYLGQEVGSGPLIPCPVRQEVALLGTASYHVYLFSAAQCGLWPAYQGRAPGQERGASGADA